jgi:hypothetical protein
MAYPQLDADHLAQWDLNEKEEDLLAPIPGVTEDNVNNPPRWRIHRPFVDAVGEDGTNDLSFYDTNPPPGYTNSKLFEIGVPGPFGGAIGFFGGSETSQRDYLFGAPSIAPALITVDQWILPYAFGVPGSFILKEFSPTAWVSPWVSLHCYQNSSVPGSWAVKITVGTTGYTLTVGASTVLAFGRLRLGVWNHIGVSFDGTTLRAYVNGVFAASMPVAGVLGYGAGGGYWVIGSVRNTIGGLETPNAAIARTRISQIARPDSYFHDSYQGLTAEILGASGGGVVEPPVILAPPPITIVGRGPGGLGLRLD